MCYDLNITWLGEPWTHSIFLSGLQCNILFTAVSWEVETIALYYQIWPQPFSSFLPFLFVFGCGMCLYHVCFLLHMEIRSRCQFTASISLNFWNKDGYFGPGVMASELLNRPLCLPYVGITEACYRPSFRVSSGDLNSGPYACMASALPTELFTYKSLKTCFELSFLLGCIL